MRGAYPPAVRGPLSIPTFSSDVIAATSDTVGVGGGGHVTGLSISGTNASGQSPGFDYGAGPGRRHHLTKPTPRALYSEPRQRHGIVTGHQSSDIRANTIKDTPAFNALAVVGGDVPGDAIIGAGLTRQQWHSVFALAVSNATTLAPRGGGAT